MSTWTHGTARMHDDDVDELTVALLKRLLTWMCLFEAHEIDEAPHPVFRGVRRHIVESGVFS